MVIQGGGDINRAVDGDIVAVELFGIEKWLGGDGDGGDSPSGDGKKDSNSKEGEANAGEENSDKARIAADTAEPSVRDTDNIAEEVPVDDQGQLRHLLD